MELTDSVSAGRVFPLTDVNGWDLLLSWASVVLFVGVSGTLLAASICSCLPGLLLGEEGLEISASAWNSTGEDIL